MGRVTASAAGFARLLGNLQPTGDAWPTEPGSVQQQALAALSHCFADLNDRANYLVTDAFPGTTRELLPQWESSLGLPDACSPLAATVQQREQAVVAKLIAVGGASIPYLIAFAAALGVAVTIDQFAAFRADASCADEADNDDAWDHAWQVNAPYETVDTPFRSDASVADEPLDVYQTGVLECRLRAIAPAQTVLLFSYAAPFAAP